MRPMLALVVLLGGCGGAQRVGGLPQVSDADEFAGLPALSADGKTIALPALARSDFGEYAMVRMGVTGDPEAEAETISVREPPTGEDGVGDPAHMRTDALAKLNARLAAGKFATLPFQRAAAKGGVGLPLDLDVDDLRFAFTGSLAKGLTVSVRRGRNDVGRVQVEGTGDAESAGDPVRVVLLGASVVRAGDKAFGYVRIDEDGGLEGSGRWTQWVLVPLALR